MATQLQIKLNNVKLYNEMNKLKKESQLFKNEKNQAKDLIIQYKTALENNYATWEQELTEREQVIREKERELQIAE